MLIASQSRENRIISPDTSIQGKLWSILRTPTTILRRLRLGGIATFGHADISALAYELWQARGCPDGSPEEDWFHAAEALRSRAHTN
jgi:Protein of unknown function (DUF2934)